MAFSNATVLAAWQRAGGRCECGRSSCGHGPWKCGKVLNWKSRGNDYAPGGWEAHHKVAVSSGGSDSLSNCEMTEGGDRDKLGRGSVWHGEIPDCLHQNHVFALATKEQLNVEYLSYLTTSSVGRDYFDFTAKKTTNLASTNATTILEFKIPFPSREEQDQIVAFLNTECGAIDELMARNDDTIAALKEYRQSVIYEAVTGKIEVQVGEHYV